MRERFRLGVTLSQSITARFDFYILADTSLGTYRIFPKGTVKRGIKALYKNVPGRKAPYSLSIRSAGTVPRALAGSTVWFYSVAVEAGKLPPVSRLSQLTADTRYVIAFAKTSAVVQ